MALFSIGVFRAVVLAGENRARLNDTLFSTSLKPGADPQYENGAGSISVLFSTAAVSAVFPPIENGAGPMGIFSTAVESSEASPSGDHA